jgi:hypothetical protein
MSDGSGLSRFKVVFPEFIRLNWGIHDCRSVVEQSTSRIEVRCIIAVKTRPLNLCMCTWPIATTFFLVGWDLRHQVLRPLLTYCTAPDDRWGWMWSNWWNEDWQGKPKYSEKTILSAILSTTNPTWPDPCANTGRRGGKPATNRLSYGAAVATTCLTPFPICTDFTALNRRVTMNVLERMWKKAFT